MVTVVMLLSKSYAGLETETLATGPDAACSAKQHSIDPAVIVANFAMPSQPRKPGTSESINTARDKLKTHACTTQQTYDSLLIVCWSSQKGVTSRAGSP